MAIFIRKKGHVSPFNIGGISGGWLDEPFISKIDMNSYAKNSIVKELRSKLRILTPTRLKSIKYFFTYRRSAGGSKSLNSLYVKKFKNEPYIKIDRTSLTLSGASPYEFKEFLEKIGAQKQTNVKEILENI